MQGCLQQIEPAKLQRFLKRGQHTKTQIETLCAEGDREFAQDLAITFVDLYKNDSTARSVKRCSERAPSLVPQFDIDNFNGTANGRHVCELL